MKKFFNTKEKAYKHMEYRKQCAYNRIKKSNDEILGDASFVYKNDDGKWLVFVQIITRNMMRELEKLQDFFGREVSLIPFTIEEKIIKQEKQVKQVKKKFKTLDIEDYTINKEL